MKKSIKKEETLKRFNKVDNTFTDSYGLVLSNLHKETEDCHQYGCVIHNPSDHSMKNFPLLWRADKRIFERICSHGVGHNDPDDLNFRIRVLKKSGKSFEYEGIHGCDLCCKNA